MSRGTDDSDELRRKIEGGAMIVSVRESADVGSIDP